MPDGATRSARSAIPRVRKMGFDFSEVPRRWFYDSAFITASANALNILFPAGERFFVRSVKHYLPQIEDPTLRARVRAFFGQEGAHGHEHEQLFEMLEAHGYEIRTWLRWYNRVAFDGVEKHAPPLLCLSATVALEHLTAALAEVVFKGGFIEHAHPTMAALIRWHAAEELEHKSVAFDVLQEIDPRYITRVMGMVVGIGLLIGFWNSGMKSLLRQEKGYTREDLKREREEARARGQDRRPIFRAMLSYFRPGFHPDQHDTTEIYEGYLRSIGRLDG